MTLTLFWSNLAARVTWECHQLARSEQSIRREKAEGSEQDLSAFAKREVLHLIPSFLPARGLWSDPTTSLGVVCYFYLVLAGSGAVRGQSRKHKLPLLLKDGFTSPPLIPVEVFLWRAPRFMTNSTRFQPSRDPLQGHGIWG